MLALWLAVGLLDALQAASQVTPQPAPAPHEYVVGPEDILKITVYGHDDLSQLVVVQPDGSLVFPLIGRVEASEKTIRDIERTITDRLLKGFIRDPQVTVTVSEYRSHMVFILGEVARPGSYPLTARTTVVEILARAGPMTSNAGMEVLVVRPQPGVQGPVLPSQVGDAAAGASEGTRRAQVFRINVPDLQAGELEKNLVLMTNDTVFVPVAPKIFVSGEVKSPGAFPFAQGLSVRQAITLAGGLSEDGSTGRIRIVRESAGRTKELKAALEDRLMPGDTVVVKAKLF